MSRDVRISELLEELLETDRSAEDVCADYPELLDEVRVRLKRLRDVEVQIESLFPLSETKPITCPIPFALSTGNLPVVNDHEIQAELGRGGMGVVYRARHVKLNRIVALKMLLPGSPTGRQEHARFMKEAEAVAALKHPNVVQIYDFGEVAGQPYFTMEYVEGGSLAQKMAGAVVPVRDAAKIISALAQAAFAAHQAGIIHRDLKPANILVADNNTPKIGDFGLARRIDRNDGLTRTGMLLGTPIYMAPEQMSGKPASVGPAADIFSLGAILYEMLVGKPPFLGDSFSDTERRLLREEPVPPSRLNAKVPRDLETICLKCLEKEPEHRYATARDLAADLDRFLNHEPIHARPIKPAERAMRWIRRNPLPAALAVTAIILVGVLVGNALREQALSAGRLVEKSRLIERYESGLQMVQEGRFAEARAILGKLGDGGHEDLRQRIDQTLADLDLVEDLDAVGVRRDLIITGQDDSQHLRKIAAEEYAGHFARSGLGRTRDDLQLVAERINRSDIKGTLVAALDDWAVCEPDKSRRNWLLNAARRADPDPDGWHDRARDPVTWSDRNQLLELIAQASSNKPSVHLLRVLGDRLAAVGEDPVSFFKQVQEEHADSFLANFSLANALRIKDPAESIRFYQAALAIRPSAVPAGNNLAVALSDVGRTDDAIAQFRHTLELDPQSTHVRFNLGLALLAAQRNTDAISELQQVVKSEPKRAAAYRALGQALFDERRYSEAETALQRYLELLPADDPGRADATELLQRCRQQRS